jgi:hypothetical protein
MPVPTIKFLERLYTLAADPITEEKSSARGSNQGPTRPFTDWMDAVNQALIDLLTETAFIITDAFLEDELELVKDALGRWIINDLLFEGSDVIRFDTACDVIISGINEGRPSQQTTILSLGLGRVSLLSQSGLSEPANQILTTPRSQVDLAPGVGFARLYYDGVSDLWRVIQHEQGAPLTPNGEFFLTAFSADGATWTVPDVSQVTGNVFAYYLKGAMLFMNLRLLNTSVSGNADRLRVQLPLDYVAKKHMSNLGFVRSPSFSPSGLATLWQSDFSSRDINIEPMNAEKISGSPVDILGQCWIEIGSQGGELGTGPAAGGSTGGGAPSEGGGGGTDGSVPPRFSVPAPSGINSILRAYDQTAGTALQEINRNGGDAGFRWLDGAILALRAAQGPRWGYRGNRGDTNTLSADAALYWGGPLPPVFKGTINYNFDLVEGSRGSNPKINARDGTDYSGAQTSGWARVRTSGRIGGA